MGGLPKGLKISEQRDCYNVSKDNARKRNTIQTDRWKLRCGGREVLKMLGIRARAVFVLLLGNGGGEVHSQVTTQKTEPYLMR